MRSFPHFIRRSRFHVAITLALALALVTVLVAAAAPVVIQISEDPFTNPTSQHKTQVEPDSYSWGSTIVAVTQSGRFVDGGSSDIGYATSNDGGKTWIHDFLNCITVYKFNNCGNLTMYDRVSDPSIAYDAKHKVWLAATLPIKNGIGAGVLVSPSTDDGKTFGNPITVHTSGDFHDKSWIACDDTSTSPFFGNCYVEWDDASRGDLVQMNTSSDGGQTWSAPKPSADNASGLGGQPLAQPNGTVVVPFAGNGIQDFISTDGGASWSTTKTISFVNEHPIGGGIRTPNLPSAEVDGDGRVYVVWYDCRFRTSCSSNDIVGSASNDGITWTQVLRVPIDKTTSKVDHFLPGIGVDRNSKAPNVRIGLVFYYYPDANCTFTNCQLNTGFIGSLNGGKTWIGRTQLAGPMSLSWLAQAGGAFVGDYMSTSISNGRAVPIFEVAHAPSGGLFDEALYTVQGGLDILPTGPEVSGLGDQPVPGLTPHYGRPTLPFGNTLQ